MDSRADFKSPSLDKVDDRSEEEDSRLLNLGDYTQPHVWAFENAVASKDHQQRKTTGPPNKYYPESSLVPDATNIAVVSVTASSPPKGVLKETSPEAGVSCSHDRKLKFGLTPEQEVKSAVVLPTKHYTKMHKKIKLQRRLVRARKMEDEDRDTGVTVNLVVKGERFRQGPEWDARIPAAFSWKGKKMEKGERVVEQVSNYETRVWQQLWDEPAEHTP